MASCSLDSSRVGRDDYGKTFAELKALGNKPDTKTDALVELLTYYKATFFTGF